MNAPSRPPLAPEGFEPATDDTMHDEQRRPTAFDRFLSSPHYEKLRGRLVRMFARRGCDVPEDLADEAISRVVAKLPEVGQDYEGDPLRYIYAVAKNVYREYARRPKPLQIIDAPNLQTPPDDSWIERRHQCLDECIEKLPPEDGELVRAYYLAGPGVQIVHRRELAERLGMGQNALRIRVFRIRQRLLECLTARLSRT